MYQIRKARPEDAKAIAEVHVQSWKATYHELLDEQDISNTTIEHRQILWETVLKLPRKQQPVTVIEENGSIVGFISGGKERTDRFGYDGEIYAIYLLPTHQRKGLGKQLLTAFTEEMKELGYRSLLVWVLTKNPTHQFYLQLGAQRIEQEQTTIGQGTYQETAYGFNSLDSLIAALMMKQRQ
ncbi:GNAT family N-acetyltransferase [Gracilibacillus caseinilyticus]|uniref:GNAT family N-acetyltransferase n=1 Tax=Gracilibacillus caseinilyticus TaxID=2932256 RepID=A0ABY4EQQ4_9BACI|nr:GNAT family N-acetyltransferase [Gracilibacillus caseinilyticus]UOQ46779.1 GNAT family N-acetyltransferase [Gracilibacillus caseinilyticus]